MGMPSVGANPAGDGGMAGGAGKGGPLRLRQTPTSLEQALAAAATLRRARRLPTADRCGHLLACPKAACLYSIVQQVPANNFGLGHLRSLRAALYPGKGYVRLTPVRRVHRGHSAGSPWAGMKPDTLMNMRTDLKAVATRQPK